ncbi:hypothetical protein EAE96_000610 [Botrytis aclada]|nr:hypothetical protein EAE96_000610 [Botrytis aclada]
MEEEKAKKLPPRVVQNRLEFDTTYHPGIDPKDLIHLVHGTTVSELKLPKGFTTRVYNIGEIFCHNCGMTDPLAGSGYTSRVKIVYSRQNNAIWELGGPDGAWLLKDEMNIKDSKSVDYTVQKFLRDANTSIPLVEMYKFGASDEKFHFTMMSRAKGVPLCDVGDLCKEQKDDLMNDFVEHIRTLRQFTSPNMQRVDGGELNDMYIGNCTGYGCVKTGRNEEEWLENLTPALRKHLLWKQFARNEAGLQNPKVRDAWIKKADEELVELKANFPVVGGPYVLSHGDLHTANIYCSNNNAENKWKVTAIIDWETAGYFPWWVELLRNPIVLRKGEEQLSGLFPPTFDMKDWKPMLKAIAALKSVWECGGGDGMGRHGKRGANRWVGKELSKGRERRRQYLEWDMGWSQEHDDVYDPELTDPEDDPESRIDKDKYVQDKGDRAFLRWFKEISNS